MISIIQQIKIKSQMCHPDGVWHEFLLEKCECSLIASFEEMVERYPTHIAIKMGEESLTYREFNGRVNQLAHAILCELGTGAEAVFLLMDLSIESIIAIFAVLKAGKFYSSPALKHPQERLAQILETGQPAV